MQQRGGNEGSNGWLDERRLEDRKQRLLGFHSRCHIQDTVPETWRHRRRRITRHRSRLQISYQWKLGTIIVPKQMGMSALHASSLVQCPSLRGFYCRAFAKTSGLQNYPDETSSKFSRRTPLLQRFIKEFKVLANWVFESTIALSCDVPFQRTCAAHLAKKRVTMTEHKGGHSP